MCRDRNEEGGALPRQNPAGFPPLSDAEPERGVSRMKGKNLGRLFLGYDKKEEERSSSFLIMASACRAQLFRFAVVMLSLLAALFPSACCPLPFGLLPSSLLLAAVIPLRPAAFNFSASPSLYLRFTVVTLSLLAALLPSACRRHASLSGLSPSCFPRWRPAAVLGCPYPSRREGSVAPMPLRP